MEIKNSKDRVTSDKSFEAEKVIPVIEEFADIETKLVNKETVIVSKKVIEEIIPISIPAISEHYEIERVAMNEFVESRPSIRQEDDIIIIPVMKEVIVKRLLLTEEIRLKKVVIGSTVNEDIMLKKEEVTIERKEE
ncbi:MAG TPA: DUF2382 domain-containing protein [Bacteroidales bacterium]|nr:DUF2382 domain-containing protein [Bacteroidales bacterium]